MKRGDSIAYFGDHVDMSDGGNDFASTIGVGGVVGTNGVGLVGYSMGGLIARYYLRFGTDDVLDQCVNLDADSNFHITGVTQAHLDNAAFGPLLTAVNAATGLMVGSFTLTEPFDAPGRPGAHGEFEKMWSYVLGRVPPERERWPF